MMAYRAVLSAILFLGVLLLAAGHDRPEPPGDPDPFDDDIIKCAEDIEECFEKWALHYKYTFDYGERPLRLKTFKENIMYVSERMKGEALCHFRLGLNAFAAMSKQEFDGTRLGGLSKKLFEKSGLPNHQSNASYPVPAPGGHQRRLLDFHEHQRMLAALPTTVDWRTKGVVNPIRDQYPCSGCYAFAAVSTVESFMAINTGRLPQLSEKDIINCCVGCPCCGTACDGGYIESTFEYMKATGAVAENSLPFKEPIEGRCPLSAAPAGKTKIDDYQVKYYPELKEADIMALVVQHPVAVYFYADTDFEARWYKGGVLTTCPNRPQTGNHFMTIVGYGYDTASRKNYWLVRNSWGTSWGEDGYVKIMRGPGTTGDGVCGIQYLAAWPIKTAVVPRRRKGGRRGMKKKGRKGHRAKKGGKVAAPVPAPKPAAPLALGQCDFFFTGSASTPETARIPVIPLKRFGDNVYEHTIAAYNKRTKSVVDVFSANSNYACTDNGVRKPGGLPLPNCHFVFQFTYNRLSTKTFNNPDEYKAFTSQAYIRIPITGAQLAGYINLNKGDQNTDFPEDRRCIIFTPAAA